MTRRLIPGLLLAALPLPAWSAPDVGMIPSVATVDDAPALGVNPAGLGTDPGASLHLATSGFRELGAQALSLSLGFGAGGLGLRHEPGSLGDRQEFSLATAIPLAPGLRGGLAYRLGRVADRGGADYDLGLLLRPADWLSVGGAIRGVGGGLPGDPRAYQVGLALRPVGDRLTLNLDGGWPDGRRIQDPIPSLGVDLEILDGVFLRGEGLLDTAAVARGFGEAVSVRAGLALASARMDAGGLSGKVRVAAVEAVDLAGSAAYLRFREARGRALWAGAPEILNLRLRGDLGPDRSALGLIAALAERPPVATTLEVLDRARTDPQVRGIALTVDGIGVSLADVQEVRDALAAVRSAGKPVVAYLPGAGFEELYLASVADRVLLNPVGTIRFTGFSREDLYLRGALAKIGIKAEFVTTGPYKTAPEPLIADAMSEPNRRQLEELTGDQFDQVVAGIAIGRRRSPDEIKAQIDRGILSAPEALQAGLVDDLQSQDEVEGAAAKVAGGGVAFDAFKRPVRMRSWLPPRVAVVYASGAITSGLSGNDLLMGRLLGEDTLVGALRQAREDARTRAIVLRIDSPGGTPLASEGIRREIERTVAVKPVIVSMGGVAASGGYWIACGANRILADPATITGSIGVYTGRYSAQGLLEQVGVKVESVGRGRFAGLNSPFHDLTPAERQLLQNEVDFNYARFLELVSHSRHMPQGKVKELAGGRVYSGNRALAVGLIDREAGLLAAIEEARAGAGLAPDAEVELAYMPEQRPFLLSDDPLVFFDATYQLRKAVAGVTRWTRYSVWALDPRLAP